MTTAVADKSFERIAAKITPHRRRFAWVADSAQTTTEAGLHIPDADKNRVATGTIIATGAECEFEAGSRAFVPAFAGDPLTIEGTDVVLFHVDDLIAVISGDAEVKGVSHG